MLYRSKLKWIGRYVAGKKVLDLGCVCHQLDISNPPWLHGYICERAKSALGVDILPEELQELQRRGFNVVLADVETMDLGEQFDVIVAGDIIEHLADHGAFLERARAHLNPGGLLLITTPNPVTLVRLLRTLGRGDTPAHHQHTCWFTAKVLRQLAERYGFEAVDESYADDTRIYYRLWPAISSRGGPLRRSWRRLRVLVKRLLWRPLICANSLLCLIRPGCAETLCMAFRYPRREGPIQTPPAGDALCRAESQTGRGPTRASAATGASPTACRRASR